jgi:ribokinase
MKRGESTAPIPSCRVVVLGSLNVDHTLSVDRLPGPGETVVAHSRLTDLGGQGANQAVAASRAGARVRLIGCVGDDDPGHGYKASLEREGVEVSGVAAISGGEPTGSAFIVVDRRGENTIAVHAGANALVTPDLVDRQRECLLDADVLLVQLECPLAAVAHATRLARDAGVKTVVNPSPWNGAFTLAEIAADYVIANESEAVALTGVSDLDHGRLQAFVMQQEMVALIVTRGPRPTLVVQKGSSVLELHPPTVEPVSTVGAGDSFAGAFATAIGEGRALLDAVAFANAAGSLATLKQGAQAAIPERGLILRTLREREPTEAL